jgi:hypothetical protein
MTQKKRKVTDIANIIEHMLSADILNGSRPSLADIQKFGNVLQALYPDATVEEINQAVHLVESRVNVVIRPAHEVTKGFEPWVSTSGAVTNPYYWDRYAQHLSNSGKAHIVRALDRETLRLLDLTADPTAKRSWDRRGLVLGNVQSGKTANYTGLICHAADAGYKVIIVLAGIHNNLRNQTQERIDEGFIGSQKVLGKSAQGHTQVGVGLINSDRQPTHFTSKARDFTQGLAETVGMSLSGMAEPGVFVVKKNASTLRSLLKFLNPDYPKNRPKTNEALLLIDDEADNASINVAKDNEVSTINGLIRDLLGRFERSAYVGYTATPFANIFIDPKTPSDMVREDLFPRSFIVSLDAPSDYFGPSKLFLEAPDEYLRKIDDYEQILPLKHKIDLVVSSVPESLSKALRAYVLTRAIRVLRLQGSEHSAMLINVSRFNNVQNQIHEVIDNELSDIRNAIRVSSGLGKNAMNDKIIAKLKTTFESEFSRCEFDWDAVLVALWEGVAPIEVVTVNSKSSGNMNYDAYRSQGRHVIAIGGFSLSRGLTLEGLSTTYFLRNSVMYDTLLQMGRWFGYRPDYDDLVRIWLPADAINWYAHIAVAVGELRDDLRRMQQQGGTPEDFGLKVRSHPDNLIITARNKSGTGEKFPISVSLGGKLVETASIVYDKDPHQGITAKNMSAVQTLVTQMKQVSPDYVDNTTRAVQHWRYGYVFQDIPRSMILQFLDSFEVHPNLKYRFKELNKDYILKRGDAFAHWDVYFPTLQNPHPLVPTDSTLDLSMNLRTRVGQTIGGEENPHGILITAKARVGEALDESIGLSAEKLKDLATTRGARSPSGKEFREVGRRPLLIVHILAIGRTIKNSSSTESTDDVEYAGPYPAYGISFPEIASGEKDTQLTYMVNETFRDEYLAGLDFDEDTYDEELEDER